jgi:nucleotide-binding universal stress UspA family protein
MQEYYTRLFLKEDKRMFEKIAVCLDGSELAEQILPYAIEQAKRFESAVVLLRVVHEHVLVTPSIPGTVGVAVITTGMEKQSEKEEQEAENYLKTLADRLLAEYKLQAECVTLLGAPGETIVEYAANNAIGLIAIATHGRSGPGRAIFGSVADFVLRHSGLPILLIRPLITKPG